MQSLNCKGLWEPRSSPSPVQIEMINSHVSVTVVQLNYITWWICAWSWETCSFCLFSPTQVTLVFFFKIISALVQVQYHRTYCMLTLLTHSLWKVGHFLKLKNPENVSMHIQPLKYNLSLLKSIGRAMHILWVLYAIFTQYILNVYSILTFKFHDTFFVYTI